MPTIKIDELTTIPVPVGLQSNKAFWQEFPYEADIDMVNWTYGEQPMTPSQIMLIKLFHSDEYGLIDYDHELTPKILKRTIKSLRSHRIIVSKEYRTLLHQMSALQSNVGPLEHPVVITTRPGLGKTQMLIASLIEKINYYVDYSAIIVTRRVESAAKIAKAVNHELGEDYCKVRPSFTLMTQNGSTCPDGFRLKEYNHGLCRRPNCYQLKCPVTKRDGFHLNHKVVFVTSKHLNSVIDDDQIDDLLEYNAGIDPETGEEHFLIRDELIIDENPGMIFNPVINSEMLSDCMAHLRKQLFSKHMIREYSIVMSRIAVEFGGATQYEHIEPLEDTTPLSKEFRRVWRRNPHHKHYLMPEAVSTFIENGGIRQNKRKVVDYCIGISKYRKLTDEPVRTVILDGSGLKDLTYRPDEFILMDIPEIRNLQRATIHHYPFNLSKNFYFNDKGKLEHKLVGVADVARAAIGNREALFVTYKSLREEYSNLFKDRPNISVEHFGNLIGKNDFSECSVVFFAGTNDWGAMQYFTQLSAVSGKKVDLATIDNSPTPFEDPEVNGFYSSLLATGFYQDLMRSNLRVASGKKKVNIYLWSANAELLSILLDWLPDSKIETHYAPDSIRGERQPPLVSTEATKTLDALIRSMGQDDIPQTPKPRAELLARTLGRVPYRIEFEYVFGVIPTDRHPRYVKYSRECLESTP
jgi:hypothetical protein